MTIRKIQHTGVNENGSNVKNRSVMYTKGVVIMSDQLLFRLTKDKINKPSIDDGLWITVLEPRNEDGEVNGVSITFENETEADLFSISGLHEASGQVELPVEA